MKSRSAKIRGLLALTAAVALLAGCGDGGGAGGGGGDDDGKMAGKTFTIGSKEFTESKVLGQITAVALEDQGAKINDKTGIQGSATVREALESGEIDMYWDYTGTGWVNILGNSPTDVPENLYEEVKKADAENGVVWLEPAPFENTYAIAVKKSFAEENSITNLTEMAAFIKKTPDKGQVCAASEFINRDDGLPGMEKAYGFEYTDVVELDLNLVYTQIGQKCPFGEVTSTEARIASNDLQVLEDDQKFFVEYRGALTIREETLKENPAIEEIMAPISKKLTAEVLIDLNGRVDLDGESEKDVAEEWLEDEGLIG